MSTHRTRLVKVRQLKMAFLELLREMKSYGPNFELWNDIGTWNALDSQVERWRENIYLRYSSYKLETVRKIVRRRLIKEESLRRVWSEIVDEWVVMETLNS